MSSAHSCPGQLRAVVGNGSDLAHGVVAEARHKSRAQQFGMRLTGAVAKQVQRCTVEAVQALGNQRHCFHR